jgi:hypothetical protein
VGIAIQSPVAVVISASTILPAKEARLAIPWTEMTLKVLIIPETVPRRPSNSVRLAIVARILTIFSRMTA